MKKFLSMLLAVLMVVSVMIPMLTFLVAAESGDGDGQKEIVSDIPNLIITELCMNAYGYNEIYPYLEDYADTAMPLGTHYQEATVEEGTDVSKYYVKKTDPQTGVVTFEKPEEKAAVAGTTYYWGASVSVTEVVEYFEIYNAGDKPVNLYDYQIAKDASASTDGDNVTFSDITPGDVAATKHGGYFKHAGTVAGGLAGGFEAGVQYYTKDEETYTPVAAGSSPQEGVNYYYWVGEGYHVTNPDYEKGVLNPGEIAIIWNYNDNSWLSYMNLDWFKEFYTKRYSPKTEENQSGAKEYYETDLYNTLVLTLSGSTYKGTKDNPRYNPHTTTTFWLDEWGQFNYGIVPDSVSSKSDTVRFEQWTSWIFWGSHHGLASDALVKQTVTPGETNVTGTAYFVVYDSLTGEYRSPSAADNTADENGKAVPGITYYKPDLGKCDDGEISNKVNGRTIHYLYGLDNTVPLKEGTAYTIYSGDLTPGKLNNIQKFVLPNYATGLNTKTSVPDIVITEVVPDNVGDDQYEFIEVVNTSGRAINMFDYSLAANSGYTAYTNEYFNKIDPIIPGDVGNILAAEPGSIYYNNAPYNMDYESGWLQPGETAVLWSYYSSAYKDGYTLKQFRDYFGMDESVKLFAVDTDNTAYSGRGERQNLGNTGNYIYGLIPNDNINWYGDVWTSNPVFEPITYYESGKTHKTATGFPLEACESFVMCAAPFVSCAHASPGEDYGYQFTYKVREGTPNRFGIYLDIARLTYYSNADKRGNTTFAFTGSVATTDEWKASPGILTPAQQTEVTLRCSDSRYVMYMQDFNAYGNVVGYDKVSSLLGITGVADNSILLEEHENNVSLTESKGTPFLEIKDGRLYVNNRGKSDDYMLLMTDDVLNQVRNRDFTLEFAMSYDAGSINGKNGYSSVLYNFDGETLSYGAPIIRVSGYGHNAVVRNGAMFNVEDASGKNSMANTAVNGSNPLTLYEKLKGNINSVGGFANDLSGSVMMAGVDMTVRVEVSQTYGVTVSVNGIVVSRTYDVAESATFAEWSIFLEETVGNDLAMITTPDISVSYDYITLYTDNLGFNTDKIDASSLYITELNVSGGTNYYTQNASAKTDLGWIEYIEIANGGTEPVSLKDYVIIGTSKNGKMHYGNNLQWNPLTNGNNGNAYLADWLGTDNYKAKLTKEANGDCNWYNPSASEAVLQPGEVAVIFVVNGDTSFTQKNKAGEDVSIVEAACSWLNIDLTAGDAPLCILTCQNAATVTDVEIDQYGAAVDKGNARTGKSLGGDDTASCCYGIGRLNDEDGNRVAWENIYTHDYRYLESMLDLNHSMAFGQNNTGTGADIGKGGRSLGNEGYSAHYVYGNDASCFYKMGTLWTRRNAPIMNWYDAGKTSVASGKTGQYNVGKLYNYQIESFRSIQEMLANGYQSGGGLVITEFTFDTQGSAFSATGYDAYEAMEITNTSERPINLYEYALVTSSDASYGTANKWGSMTKFHPGCPVPKNHYAYDLLKDIANPEQVVVEPGESIVVWVYCWDTYKHITLEGAPVQTVEMFREHWASLGNDVINAKDEDGEYKVTVVTAVALDGAPNGNLSNGSIAKAYGIAKNSNVFFNGTVRTNSVVSYVVTASYAYHYDLRWTRHQITPSTHTGITTTGTFDWDPLLVEEVDFDVDEVLTNLCVKNAEGKYSFATAPYDQTQKHYRLYMYHNKQIFSGANEMGNFAYNFVYGQTLAGNNWGIGGIMASVKASYQTQPGKNVMYGITADAADWTPQVSATIVSTGQRTNSYGYLLPEQKAMVSHLEFSYVGELEDGTRVYFHDSVAGELTDNIVTNVSSNVSVSGGSTSLAFTAAVGNDFYNKMVALFGEKNIALGIISVRAADAMHAGMIRPAYLEGYDYIVDSEYLFTNSMNGMVNFYGTAQPMSAGYYSTTYSAVGYMQISTDAFGDITLYAENAINRSATQVLASAMFDYKTEKDEANGYIYEISAGKWSRFTAAQIARFEAICANSKK